MAGDARNSENTVIVHDATTTQAYAAAFEGLWAGMEPATQCNVGIGPAVNAHIYLPLALKAGGSGTVETPTAVPTAAPAVCACSADLYNCSDFATHTAAQACFNYCVAQGAGDVHGLDRDSDGIACEALQLLGGLRVCEDGSVERVGFAAR